MADKDSSIIPINFSGITRKDGTGNNASRLHNLFRGKNWVGGDAALPIPEPSETISFCTRPDFNMDELNLAKLRVFSTLLTTNRQSTGSLIRSWLDPRACREKRHYSDLIDPLYPFFTILDNTAMDISGWPDFTMEEWISEEAKENGSVYTMAQGSIKRGGPLQLNIQHHPVNGDLVNQVYSFINEYIYYCKKDAIRDYQINVDNDRRTYLMRWYTFGFDSTGTKVIKATMTGEAWPMASQLGATMNSNSKTATMVEPITATWSCAGVYHNDPIIIDEFNRTVVHSNPNMADDKRLDHYVKLGNALDNNGTNIPSLGLARDAIGYGYPRINPYTLEFEIWLEVEQHKLLTAPIDLDDIEEVVSSKSSKDLNDALEDPSVRALLANN